MKKRIIFACTLILGTHALLPATKNGASNNPSVIRRAEDDFGALWEKFKNWISTELHKFTEKHITTDRQNTAHSKKISDLNRRHDDAKRLAQDKDLKNDSKPLKELDKAKRAIEQAKKTNETAKAQQVSELKKSADRAAKKSNEADKKVKEASNKLDAAVQSVLEA